LDTSCRHDLIANDGILPVSGESDEKNWHIVCMARCSRDLLLQKWSGANHRGTMSSTEKPYVIVAGIDYSGLSRLALHQAFQAASEQPRGEVHVLHVHPSAHADPDHPKSDDEMLVRALDRVQRIVRDDLALFQKAQPRLGPRPFGLVSHVRSGSAAVEIAQLADDLRANLVVVGMQGRTGTARLLLGSVAQAVLALAPCPVLVVRDRTFGLRASNAELPRAHHQAKPGNPEASVPPLFDRN
jgi:nucleotide-binding universal stress UspA family protein